MQADSSNVRTGTMSLKFWDNESIDYTVEQEITLDKGIYKLGAYVEGGDCGENAEFKLYAKVGEHSFEIPTGVTGWQNWANPQVEEIKVDPAKEAQVVIEQVVKCVKKVVEVIKPVIKPIIKVVTNILKKLFGWW